MGSVARGNTLHSMEASYPVMLNLAGKSCVVVGGGKIATRKTHGLVEAGAEVTVISPELSVSLDAFARERRIRWVEDNYQTRHLESICPWVVIAATNSSEVNRQVAEDAYQVRAWVNVVDGSSIDDFSNMMSIQRPPITISLSTGGTSPALGKRLLDHLEEVISEDFIILAAWMGELRPYLKSHVTDQARREEIYKIVLESNILDLLRQGKQETARHALWALVQNEVSA